MPKRSAGLLLFRGATESLELFLVHPGGPFWAKKDEGAWSIPKGEYGPGEDPLEVALREFAEETGLVLEPGQLHDLGEARQAGGKIVRAYAMEGDADSDSVRSNEFELEWPPRSGRSTRFPEGRSRRVVQAGRRAGEARPRTNRAGRPPRRSPVRGRTNGTRGTVRTSEPARRQPLARTTARRDAGAISCWQAVRKSLNTK
jgi:predicted NUDIX family NTP pyrophosphohydrolase